MPPYYLDNHDGFEREGLCARSQMCDGYDSQSPT